VAQSDILDPILNISKVMSSLRAMTEPRGISQATQSVTRDDDRPSDKLSSTEQSRLKESATIIGKVLKIGAFKEGPEAQRLGDLTPSQAQAIKTAPAAVRDKIQPVKKDNFLGDLLSSLLGLLGLSGLSSVIGKIKNWLLDKFSKFIFTPMKKLFAWVGNKLWSAVKWVGNKLWGALKWAGGKISSGVKWLGSKIYKWGASIVDKMKNSKFFKGMMGVLQSAKDGIKSLWDDALKAVSGFVDNLVSGITKLKDGALNLVKKIPGYEVLKKGFEKTATAGKAVGGAVVEGSKAVASGAKSVATMALGVGQSKIAKYLGDFLSKGASTMGKALAKAPIIGPVIASALAYNDIQNFKQQYKEGKMSLRDLEYSIGERVIKAITGLGGAAIGGVLGSIVGPIGTVIGAVGGDIIGSWAGELFADKLLNPSTVRKLGSFFHKEEMQDFLVKNGCVYKFNTRDEVLGMKTGGAIDNLLNGLTQGLAKDNSIIRDASIAQVNKLDELIYLMTEYLKRSTQTSSSPFKMSNDMGNLPTKSFNIREQFANQTLIPTTLQPI
jgi:hypothetical protein